MVTIMDKAIIRDDPLSYYIVTGSNVNLRKAPSLNGYVIGYLQIGDDVHNIVCPTSPYEGQAVVQADGYTWLYVYVQSGSLQGANGWVASAYLKRKYEP